MQQFEETSDCFEKPHKRLCLPLTYRLPKMLSESLVNFMRFLIFTRQWNKSLHWHATTLPRWNITEAMFSTLGAFIRYCPEVDILPGKTWKCSMRSAFYWFAEFCHSQRLSHFAASFIVTRAEGSIAKSCKNKCWYNWKKFQIWVEQIIYWQLRYPQMRAWQPPSSQSTHVAAGFMRSQ